MGNIKPKQNGIIKIKNAELIEELIGEVVDFPKYTTQLLNLANRNAKGTVPRVVGQLTELIQECPEKTYEGWKKWYLEKHPNTIENATKRIEEMIIKLKKSITLIDRKMIKEWVEDLVLEKTFIGLRFQEAILKKLSVVKKTTYRLATPEEEAKGIDGLIGETPISIKPITYRFKKDLPEKLKAKVVFYEKVKDGIKIDISQIM